MRTIILVFFTAFVLALGYLGYWWMQKPTRPQAKAPGAEQRQQQPLAPTANDSGKPIGPGKGAWVKRYDTDTAQLISRFKAEDYQPRSDGWVVVKKPRAQFFMKDGRAISIEGDTGEIIMDDPGRRGSKGMPAGKAETPSRGRLHNVVIKLFHDIDVPERQLEDEVTSSPEFAKNHIGLTIALENAAFNNESFKITSEAFKDRTTGRTVPSDQVPVVMRGVDYDFDGKGLTILWNERDRRLQYLEVAHGQRLVVHRPSQVMKSREAAPAATAHLDGAPVSLDWSGGLPFLPSFAEYYAEPVAVNAPAAAWPGVPYALPAHRPLPLALAAKNPAAAADAIPPATTAPTGRRGRNAPVPKPKITPSTEPPLYLATFRDNVRVVQGADLDVSANLMAIQFLMQDQGEEDEKKDATTQPTTKPTTAPAGGAASAALPSTNPTTQPAVAATSPSTRSPKRAALEAAAAAAAAAAEAAKAKPVPTTKPAVARRPRATTRPATSRPGEPLETPITITWTGALTIKPLTAEPESPLRSGDAVVRLDGAPVKAVATGSTIECGVLTYRTREQIMNLVPVGPDQPVVLRDAKGAVVRTALMDFDQAHHKAILGGKSEATFPQEDDNGKPGAPLTAKWTKSCTLYFEAPPAKPKGATDAVQATAELPGIPPGGAASAALSPANKSTTKPATASPFGGNLNIDRATLEGDVAVDRPGQLKLRSQHLELAFDNTPRPGLAAATAPKITVVAPAAPAVVPGDPAQSILVGRRDALAAELKKAQAEFQTVTGGDDLSARQSKLLATLDATDARLREIQKRLTEIAAGDPKATPEESKALTDELTARKTYRDSLQDEATQLGRNMIRADELQKLADASRAEHAKVEKELVASGMKPAAPVNVAQATPPGGATTKPAPTFRSDLRQMIATGTVHCELTDSNKKTQFIDCQRLDLQTARTPDGKVYPRTIIADGGVHAVDPEQDLRAGRLAVTLRPSTRPTTTVAASGTPVPLNPGNPAPVAKKPKADSADTAPVELESLLASTNVKVLGKDGTQAIADQLIVDNKDGKNVLKLLGQPTATLIDKKNKLTGPTIVVLPDDQRLDVFGAGSMTGVQDAKAGPLPGAAPAAPQTAGAANANAQPAPERPITVTWTQSLAADAKANTVDVLGGVVAVMKDADGATNTAKGNRVRMTLADVAPATRPTDGKPGAIAAAAIEGAAKSQKANPYGAMGAKTVRTISFNEAAEVSSVTLADNGNILRRTHLEAPTITYDLLARSMNIPVPGRMIVEDHRPVAAAPAPHPGAAPAPAKPAGADTGDNRGTTAFLWPKSFTYDDATRVATMLGDGQKQVVIVFQDDKDKDKQYRLQADRVNAELEQLTAPPAPADAPKPPADKPAEQKVAMKRVTASGGLHFVGPGGADVLADQMEFDPKAQTLMARGDGRSRVTFTLPPNAGANQLDMIKFRISDYRILDSAGVQVRMAR